MSDYGHALLAQLDADDLVELRRLLSMPEPTPNTTNTGPERLLTASEAAARANVSVETVRRAARSGALKVFSAGRALRIDHKDLNAWLTGPRRRERTHTRTRQPRRQSGRTPMGDAIQKLNEQSQPIRSIEVP